MDIETWIQKYTNSIPSLVWSILNRLKQRFRKSARGFRVLPLNDERSNPTNAQCHPIINFDGLEISIKRILGPTCEPSSRFNLRHSFPRRTDNVQANFHAFSPVSPLASPRLSPRTRERKRLYSRHTATQTETSITCIQINQASRCPRSVLKVARDVTGPLPRPPPSVLLHRIPIPSNIYREFAFTSVTRQRQTRPDLPCRYISF